MWRAGSSKRLGMPGAGRHRSRQVLGRNIPIDAAPSRRTFHLNYIKRWTPAAGPAEAPWARPGRIRQTCTCVIIRQYQGRRWIAVNFSPKASRDLRLGARLKALHMLDVGETVTTVTTDSQGTLVRLAPYGIAYLGPAD